MKKGIIKFLLSILIFIFSNQPLLAASISLEKQSQSIRVEDEVLVNYTFDSEDEAYNIIEGTLLVDEIFEIKRVMIGNSFLNFWIENPTETKDNSIKFAGLVPGGFNGEGEIFSIVLKAKSVGVGNINSTGVTVFFNDGEGTQKNVLNKSTTIRVAERDDKSTPVVLSLKDNQPPENFVVEIVRDNSIYDGKSVLIFQAQDKGSGIRSYDVLEGNEIYRNVKSPYLLENQKLNKRILVKARDFEGNERVVSPEIPGKTCLGTNCYNTISIIFIILFIITVLMLYKKRIGKYKDNH